MIPRRTKQARQLGFLGAGVLAGVGVLPSLQGGEANHWILIFAFTLLVAAIIFPRFLYPMLGVWLAVGHLLHRIATPLMMGVIFLGIFVPLGLTMRVLGKTPLRLRPDPSINSYWIPREQPAPAPKSMKFGF